VNHRVTLNGGEWQFHAESLIVGWIVNICTPTGETYEFTGRTVRAALWACIDSAWCGDHIQRRSRRKLLRLFMGEDA